MFELLNAMRATRMHFSLFLLMKSLSVVSTSAAKSSSTVLVSVELIRSLYELVELFRLSDDSKPYPWFWLSYGMEAEATGLGSRSEC